MSATIEASPDGLVFRSSYSRGLVAEFKEKISYNDRKAVFDGSGKFSHWLVAPGNEQELVKLCQKHLGVTPELPRTTIDTKSQTRTIEVRYIGKPKQRDDGSWSAFGYADGEWSVVFPQDVLRSWFGESKFANQTYYGILGIGRDASVREIRRAYRKMAKRWHPDVSQEDDAAAMFREVQEAWEVLSDDLRRRKYLAGLAFEESLGENAQVNDWRPPLRCGLLKVNGTALLGRFLVDEILEWGDIVDRFGRVLVTSWKYGEATFTEKWV